jgi:pyruvate carboxylase subunit A
MLRKILIANRGEIAVRIIRACAEMGIRSAAIYADADRHSLHVKKADEAYCLGNDPLAGYLNVHQIVNLAVATGCDAVHPGYGFLSENPELAHDCARRGITSIGPSAEVIARMGDKTAARLAMQQAGVPVTPGSPGNLDSLEATLACARRSAIRSCSRPPPAAAGAASAAATTRRHCARIMSVSAPRRPRPSGAPRSSSSVAW